MSTQESSQSSQHQTSIQYATVSSEPQMEWTQQSRIQSLGTTTAQYAPLYSEPARVEYIQPGQQTTTTQLSQISQQPISTSAQYSISTQPSHVEYTQPTTVQQTTTSIQSMTSIDTVLLPNKAPSLEEDLKKEFDLSKRIVEAQVPLDVNATETVTVNQETGVYANKQDELGWTGSLKISDYPINMDSSPEIIHKTINQSVNYVQPVTIKYLKPPCPPMTGEIIIKQECDMRVPKAPPLIIRQRPCDPQTPEPLVLREQPLAPPQEIDRKIISVAGKVLPPPPRRLIIEKLPMLPSKPRPIVIEKWLPCEPQKRTVKFIAAERTENWRSEKNLVILWDGLKANVTRELHNLGTVESCPEDYVKQHGASLISHYQMNSFIQEQNLTLAEHAEHDTLPKLEGDIDALKLIDLDRYGLSDYKFLLTTSSQQSVYDSVFSQAQVDSKGQITRDEARRLVVLIHERFRKTVNDQRINQFVQDVSKNNCVGFTKFKRLVVNWMQV